MTNDDIEERIFAMHPRPWRVYNKPLRPNLSKAKIIEVQDADGNAIIPWSGFDDSGIGSQAARLRLAKFIVRLANDAGPF